MSQADCTIHSVDALFHPVSHYHSPDGVVLDPRLTNAEKRAILSCWASDIYAVESCPAYRKIPGIARPLRLDDILAALRQLDDDPGPPGGAVMRLPAYTVTRAASRPLEPRTRKRLLPHAPHAGMNSPWSRESNVRRYRRLLATQLTEHERRYVERRLTEELQAAPLSEPSRQDEGQGRAAESSLASMSSVA